MRGLILAVPLGLPALPAAARYLCAERTIRFIAAEILRWREVIRANAITAGD